jgi:quercetin dioxygenase-like cupin family protein/oxalate decarboxylase/phosphoglucose isomerase-like protein (cupin superfamily)
MSNLLDDLFSGAVSRRNFIEMAAKAGLALPMANFALAEIAAQSLPKAPEGQKLSPANIGGGGRVERDFYRDWIKTSKIPMVEGYSILDAKTQEVQPWPEIGGRGVYLNFSGNVHMDTAIWEIPEGKALVQRHHFYEQIVYVLAGRGYTTFTQGKRQNKVEWAEGSLFSIPMNLVHRHFNSDTAHPARLLVISTFPYALQSFGSVGLLSNMQYDFNDRFDSSPDFFKRDERIRQRWEQANFVKDIRTAEVIAWQERGDGNASMYWDMAGNTILEPHISEFEVGSYKLGHRHPYEAIILTLNGRGFSLAGKSNLKDNEAVKMDWKTGSVVSPPFFWFHQHFNTGATVARYLAITEGDFPKRLGIPLEVEQIEKPQEDPAIRRMFEAELQKARRQGHLEDHSHEDHHDHDIALEHDHVHHHDHGHEHDHEHHG